MSKSSKYKGCVTETYYDEIMQCEVTVILDTSGRLSEKEKIANERAIARGFHDLAHLEGFLYANGLYNDHKSIYDSETINTRD